MKPFLTIAALAATLLLCASGARASVVISGTRVILPEGSGQVTVQLNNVGKTPALVESWIDRGNPNASPTNIHVPFTITPPIFRIDAGKGQALRIIYGGDPSLPADRESLFWLNVLEVPPKPKPGSMPGGGNHLQFAVRSRLKLFLRPAGLEGDPLKAPEQLTWKVVDGGAVLRVDNPTPYYITLSAVAVGAGRQADKAAAGMVAPFTHLRLSLAHPLSAKGDGITVDFTTINDYGAPARHKGRLQP